MTFLSKLDRPRMPAKANALVQGTRTLVLVASASVHDRGACAYFLQAPQPVPAHRSPETAPPVVGMRADRLELAYAVLVVEPAENVRGKAPVRCLHHAIEIGSVGPDRRHLAIALLRQPRGCPDGTMERNALVKVVRGANSPESEAVGHNRVGKLEIELLDVIGVPRRRL